MCRGEGGNRGVRVWTKGAGAGASNGKRQYKNQRAKLRPVRSTARPKSESVKKNEELTSSV